MNLFNFNKLVGVTSYLRCFPVHEHQLCFLIFFPEQSVKAKKCCWLLFAAWQRARKTTSAAVHTQHTKTKLCSCFQQATRNIFIATNYYWYLFSGRKLYVEIEFLIIGNCAANSLEIYLWVSLGLQLRNGSKQIIVKYCESWYWFSPPDMVTAGPGWCSAIYSKFKVEHNEDLSA